MKVEAAELTAALLEGAFDMRPDLKRALEVVLRDYELLWNVYIAANIVHDQSEQGGTVVVAPTLASLDDLGRAIIARNRG